MRKSLSAFSFLAAVVLIGLPLFGQSTRGGAATTSASPTATQGVPATASTQVRDASWFLNGKVLLEDGSVPTERVDIESICNGKHHTEAHLDKKGEFSFRLGATNNSVSMDAEDRSTRSAAPAGTFNVDPSVSMSMSANPLGDCVVRAILVGYRSDVILLASRTQADSPNIGTIILHRAGDSPGGTVSAASLAAPKNAQKAFSKGMDAVKDKKREEALKDFGEATRLYPQYAEAWYQLGAVQASMNEAAPSRQSYETAINVDPNFTPPYMKIAQLEEQARNWKALADITAKLIKIDPASDPLAYLYNSAANINLKDVAAAEQSARQGLKLDTQHHIPKFWYILGALLATRGDYAAAIDQYKNYLQFAPDGPDAAAVRTQMAQCEKLAAAAPKP
jgi:tetratricopeptide (TPR) repeat protein